MRGKILVTDTFKYSWMREIQSVDQLPERFQGLGEKGLKQLARINHANAVALAEDLCAIPGVELVTETFFNEFTLRLPKPGAEVIDALAQKQVLGGVPVSRLLPGEDDL